MQNTNERKEHQVPRMVLAQVRLLVNDNRRVMALIFFTDDHVSVPTERSDAIGHNHQPEPVLPHGQEGINQLLHPGDGTAGEPATNHRTRHI